MEELKSGFVTIMGRPNTGKSTFLNNLIGSKVSIVTPKPQTTRDNIRAIFTNEKMQLVFIDTPGLHKGKHLFGKKMSRNVVNALDGIDVILMMADVTVGMDSEDKFVIKWLQSQIGTDGKLPVFLLLNKIDLLEDKTVLLSLMNSYKDLFPFAQIIPFSALKEDFTVILSEIYKILSPGPQYYPPEQITDQEDDFFIAELIREKVFLYTHQEVPYSVAVRVNEITERNENFLYISANIYVEKDSQKGILLGKKGSMLKKIGTMARKDIETSLKKKVYLELFVKVLEDWTNKEKILKRWGY